MLPFRIPNRNRLLVEGKKAENRTENEQTAFVSETCGMERKKRQKAPEKRRAKNTAGVWDLCRLSDLPVEASLRVSDERSGRQIQHTRYLSPPLAGRVALSHRQLFANGKEDKLFPE
ncbi:hypothetical protein AVEN_263549-1 [Araneus ventricosus]|uniref:Uncharacterized protein n=1 Tax=Araneus ventricosus TaxID=182803 RepID=A0A4Y2JXS1_ARAVE|nr:hypothetical protein AVEN_263549-1 [Araneus ventricosus]